MSSNPFDDDYDGPDDEDGHPHFEDVGEGEEEGVFEDTPVPSVNWLCTGVEVRTLTRKGDPHLQPGERKPEQPTADASGKYMSGKCYTCEAHTLWKKVML